MALKTTREEALLYPFRCFHGHLNLREQGRDCRMNKNNYTLPQHFNYLYQRINPSPSFQKRAAEEYRYIKTFLESNQELIHTLHPRCFLQGSYRHNTAIYTASDLDIVVLCKGRSSTCPTTRESRDWLFHTVADPFLKNQRYRNLVNFGENSMCIKLNTEIKIDIIPAYQAKMTNFYDDPFYLFNVRTGEWVLSYPFTHHANLIAKNRKGRTDGNFIRAIKIFKHLRSRFQLTVYSNHIEQFLFTVPDEFFRGKPNIFIMKLFNYIASLPTSYYDEGLIIPYNKQNLFVPYQWNKENWDVFYKTAWKWYEYAFLANHVQDREEAIEAWQNLFGRAFFQRKPRQYTSPSVYGKEEMEQWMSG